jgi:hypothetical protein
LHAARVPTLDIVAEKPTAVPFPDFMTRYAPCCSGDPILIKEGETAHYRVIRHEAPHDDLTTKTAYSLFRYGSLVGWKYIIVKHVEEDGREGHLRLHPEER